MNSSVNVKFASITPLLEDLQPKTWFEVSNADHIFL